MKSLVFSMILATGLSLSTVSSSPKTTVNQTAFSAKLFGVIAQENMNKNVIISPASIQTALALAYMGAEGKTATELREGLHLGSNDVKKIQVAQQFGKIMKRMRRSGNGTIKMANRIYVKNDLPIAPKFNKMAKRYFASGAENVDFIIEKEKTIEKINNWIEKQTENKIQNLISSDDVNNKTRVVLVNAIYFKAGWETTFDSQKTTKKKFDLSMSSTKEVDMMSNEDEFGYAELADLGAKALTLRYIGTNIQMLVLLPYRLDGLAQLERQLMDVDLTKYLNRLQIEHVRVSLPKFKIEFDISLEQTLKTLGMHDLFDEVFANFTGLTPNVNGTHVTAVLHKAFIEVNETGTEAAATTVVEGGGPGMGGVPHFIDFIADHPFYFALLDKDTVYFTGHFVDF